MQEIVREIKITSTECYKARKTNDLIVKTIFNKVR